MRPKSRPRWATHTCIGIWGSTPGFQQFTCRPCEIVHPRPHSARLKGLGGRNFPSPLGCFSPIYPLPASTISIDWLSFFRPFKIPTRVSSNFPCSPSHNKQRMSLSYLHCKVKWTDSAKNKIKKITEQTRNLTVVMIKMTAMKHAPWNICLAKFSKHLTIT